MNSRSRSPAKMNHLDVEAMIKAAATAAVSASDDKWDLRIKTLLSEQDAKYDQKFKTVESSISALRSEMNAKLAAASTAGSTYSTGYDYFATRRSNFEPRSIISKNYMVSFDRKEGALTYNRVCTYIDLFWKQLAADSSRDINDKTPKFQIQADPERQAIRKRAGRAGGFLKDRGWTEETLKFQWSYNRFSTFSVVNPNVAIELCEWSQKIGWKVPGLAALVERYDGQAIAADDLANYAEDRL